MLLRLLAAALAAGLIVGAGGALLQHSSARDALRAEVAERHASLAAELAARLDAQIQAQTDVLDIVATRVPVASLAPAAGDELRAVIGAATTFDELVLYDIEGRPRAAAAGTFLAGPEDYEPRGDRGDTTSITVDSSFPPVLEVAVPIANPPGTRTGTLVGRVPLEVLAIHALRLDDRATAQVVVDREGKVLVHPDRDRVLRGEQLPLEELLADGVDVARLDRGGETHLVSAVATEQFPGAVVLDQPESVALAPVNDQLRELTLILVLVVAAIVLAVSIAGTWLLAPLRPLMVAVSRLGRGERGVRVEQSPPAEVGALAAEFNRLAEALDQRQEEVEELQRLSLLVNTRTSIEDVADELVKGTIRLLPADRAAYCSGGHDDQAPDVVATGGPIVEATALERATIAVRTGRAHVGNDSADHFAALPVTTIDGTVVGALVAVRADRPFSPAELARAEAYAAFAGVAVDNAQRLTLEQDLTSELQHAVDQRRALLSTISHEFRTPLTCIDGFSSSLIDDWELFDDERRQELVAKIHHHGSQLSDLVNRLLDFAVTERGKLDAALRPVALDEEVAAATDGMEPLLQGRELTIDVPSIRVIADPTLLRRAVANLVSNAVKYSPAGSPVTIRAISSGTRTRLEVIDEGPGLSAEEGARAFQPFWRAGSAATRPQRGTGLGLPLVAEYAKAMGGSAGVVSEPGVGSTFFLILVEE